jgi:hypothetical protein
MRGCSGAYLAQNSLATSEEQEIRQAKLVTQVAKEAGIGINTHFGLLVHMFVLCGLLLCEYPIRGLV